MDLSNDVLRKRVIDPLSACTPVVGSDLESAVVNIFTTSLCAM